jgi:hypothetical protein
MFFFKKKKTLTLIFVANLFLWDRFVKKLKKLINKYQWKERFIRTAQYETTSYS